MELSTDKSNESVCILRINLSSVKKILCFDLRKKTNHTDFHVISCIYLSSKSISSFLRFRLVPFDQKFDAFEEGKLNEKRTCQKEKEHRLTSKH